MNGSSSTTEQLWEVWQRLSPHWTPYFNTAGLDLTKVTKENFRERLTAAIKVDFRVPGLEDLSPQCQRGIEPGDPALSLFYHALASPHVHPSGIESRPEDYPTIADLEVVENFIYAAAEMTVAKLRAKANGQPLAIVVFAYEYAPAEDTVHGLHADLCFSRTGISRVGNAPSHYEPQARGFFPFTDGSSRAHVVPARFGAFVACQRKGRRGSVGPQDFLPGDGTLRFWVPIHKLFSGKECIQGLKEALELRFEFKHVNEKIRKVHLALKSRGWNAAEKKKPPFVITEELANFDPRRGLMVPFVHDPLVSPAKTDDGRFVGFRVPRNHNLGESALWLDSATNARPWPEFVHIRHKIVEDENGKQDITYLPNTTSEYIRSVLKKGGFDAANFVDWTADGYLKANCPGLLDVLNGDNSETRSLAAYSILAQPDFFPLVTQRDLTAWWKEFPLKQFIWSDKEGIVPSALSEKRLPANITLNGADFEIDDTTMTAIVGTRWPDERQKAPHKVKRGLRNRPKRQSTLSYRASSLFDPGWDISEASLNPRSAKAPAFMANYGLGSPFPEDTLICSAFGAFWPGAAPDVTRFFPPGLYPITTPLTDSEACWRAINPPEKTGDHTIEFQTLAYADFVKAIYDRKFDYARFARVSFSDFVLRTAVTARFYKYLHKVDGLDAANSERRARYAITSFRVADLSEVEALNSWRTRREETFRIEFGKGTTPLTTGPDPRITTVRVKALRVVYVGASQVAEENPPGSGKWRVRSLR